MVQGKPFARAPEAGDYFVGDEQHFVLVANLADAGEVIVLGYDHAAAPLHRLGDEARHIVLADTQNFFFQQVGRRNARRSRRIVRLEIVIEEIGVGAFNMAEARHPRLEHGPEGVYAGGAHGRQCDAVVAQLAGNDMSLVRLVLALPIKPRCFDGAFGGFRSAAGEEKSVDGRICQLGQPLAQVNHPHIGIADIVGSIGQGCHLLLRRVRELLAAMADVDVPQRRQPIDILVPF